MARRWTTWAAVAVVAAATIGGTWGAYRAARAEEPAPRFASAMPSGALVYLESRDLSALLRAWLASPTRDRYFKSASYRSFRRSRLYLKLQDRLSDLQKGFGVDVTDERLAEIAGGPSAIAIYDPGKLEVLVATEVPRERALASSLFAQSKSFEERKTAKGAPYFAREVSTDNGNLVQRIAFGYAGDRLWVGTSEALVAEAIDGPQNGGLGPAVGETIRAAGDFTAHDMLVWLDMDRAVRNKYFNLYWVQRNAKELEGLASGIVDLEFAADGVHERRWFVAKSAPAAAGGDAAALAALRAMAPPDAQLVEAKAADAGVAPALAETVFGPERAASHVGAVSASRSDDPFGDSSSDDASDDDSRPASGRYRYLDSRFDLDVDDPAALPAVPASEARPAAGRSKEPPFADRVAELVAPTSPVRYATFSSVRLAEGQLFAGFDRAVVVELGAPERFAAADFEALVRAEFGRRFIVGGDVSRVAWADSNGARTLAGALVQQGGAYRLAGRYLVVARDAAACAAIAARAAGQGSAPAIDAPRGALSRYAEVRVGSARGPFVRLTRVLDANAAAEIEEEVSAADGGDASDAAKRPVLFFSENIASLLDVARELETVRIATAVDGALVRERVDYIWSAPAPPPRPAAPKGSRGD